MLWPMTAERDSGDRLFLGGVSVVELAGRFGTPLYVFDELTLRSRARTIKRAFESSYPSVRVLFAGKAFISLETIRILREEGLGLDVVSGGELYAGLKAGVPASEITFHGNNKDETELREAISAGVGLIAVDNDHELDLLTDLASSSPVNVPILLRVNPGVEVHTHEKIKTGITDSKFGFPIWTGQAAAATERALSIPRLELRGYHAHLGSQLFDPNAMVVAIDTIVDFAGKMRDRNGFEPKEISPGGGFGIAYDEGDSEAAIADWAKLVGSALIRACERNGLALPQMAVEPGRSIVGPAAIAVYHVGSSKEIPGVRRYVSVDGGMADNIRPSLYGARYTASLANRSCSGPLERVTIAGKYCESGDILIEDIEMPRLVPGDLLAVPSAGAYCLSMASNYNHALRPAVVIVHEGTTRFVRRRETYEDLLRTESPD